MDIFSLLDISYFIHLTVDGHMNYFQFFAIMINASLNIHIQIFMWTYVFNSPECILRMELLDHTSALCFFNLLMIYQIVSKVAIPFCTLTSSV